MILKGNVRNIVTNEPISGATVVIYDRVTSKTVTVTTNTNGVYTTENIDIYKHLLEVNVSHENFIAEKREIQVPDNPYMGSDYAFGYDINLRPCCVTTASTNVSGRVTE